MTREELNTHLLYGINSNLVALQLMIADYMTSDGKVNKDYVKQTIGDSYETLAKHYKIMAALDKDEKKLKKQRKGK